MSYTSEIRSKIGHDPLIVVGAGIFIYKDRKVLLHKRRDNGFWSMHGGGIEIGESVEACAKRELFEETGLVANSIQFLGIFSGEDMFYTYPNGDQVYIVGIYYICNDYSGELLAQTMKQWPCNGLMWTICPLKSASLTADRCRPLWSS